MQDILSFVKASSPLTLAPSASETVKTTGSDNSFSESFFSIILGEFTKESKNVSLNDFTQELTTTPPLELSSTNDQEAKSIDEHLLDDLLSVINALQQDPQTKLFPTLNLSSSLEKILGSETTRQDFANVKNISDLMDLSKKYDLGLEKLSISKESLETLQTKFPKLSENNFFDDLKTALNSAQTSKDSDTKPAFNATSNTINILDKQTNQTDTNTKQTPSLLSELFSKKEVETKLPSTPIIILSEAAMPTVDTSAILKVNDKQQNTLAQALQTSQEEIKQTTSAPLEVVVQKVANTNETKILSTPLEPQEELVQVVIPRANILKKEPLKKSEEETIDAPLKTLKTEKVSDTSAQEEVMLVQKNIHPHETETTTSSEEPQTTIDVKNDLKTTLKQDITAKPVTVKESLNQFATDLREKIEAYKPPIMKVELSLSPKNLGDVDVTLLTRGNNLHVNISSNATTMSLFTQNQNDVKNALINMGFTNLEMNFSDQNTKEQAQQNKQKQNHENFEEFNEEETALLEIVIPQYV